jgi:Na+-driven multidrug efflux pump
LLLTKLAYPVAVMGMLIILYIASAPLIYSILFPFYPEAVFYSQILAVGLIPTLGINILSSILKARKETKKIYIANIVSGVLQLSLSLVLMYFFGLLGLSIGIVTYKSIMLIFYFFLLYVASKKTEPPMSDKSAPVL